MNWRGTLIACLCCLSAVGSQAPNTASSTFRAGTRLVQIEVVVRGKHGVVKGLTRDDFTLLDQGKPRRIDVFRAGQSEAEAQRAPLAPGAVSNRVNSRGESLPSATVVLFDQLNTRFDFKDYERKALLKVIRGLGPGDSVAIYALGKNLHALLDFTDDPGKLLAAVTKLDSGRDLFPANVEDALTDFPLDSNGQIDVSGVGDAVAKSMNRDAINRLAGLSAQVSAATNADITTEALRRIVQHLAGMPGRRNLIWIKEDPIVPPGVIPMLLQADIALYPVLIRTVLYDAPDFMAIQHAGHDLGALTGGAGFDDAGDLRLALATAVEDAKSAYVLGYYPSEKELDGKFHRLTVTVKDEKGNHLEIRYRPGYVASKPAHGPRLSVTNHSADLADLFENPLDASAIGLAAETSAGAVAGKRRVRLSVDLHDVHLERDGGRFRGQIDIAFWFNGVMRGRTIDIDLPEEQLAEALNEGYVVVAEAVPVSRGVLRLAVRDPSTGLAGSLTLPQR